MHAVRGIEVDFQAAGRVLRLHHFVDVCRAEILARIAELGDAAFVADRSVVNDQVCGLVFFVLRARVIQIGQLIEGEFAIAFGGADDLRLRTAVGCEGGRDASCDDGQLRCCTGRAGRVRR